MKPLDEQRRIVAYLDSVQARLASLRELQSATAEELRPHFGRTLLPPPTGMISVLDRAFKGELVGQEVEDESAEVMVERIRKAKENG